MWGSELLVILAMIALNSVFASYEIALASVGLGRLHALVAEGRRGAAAALRMKQKMESSFAVIQLGINLVGATAAATGGAGAAESLEPLLEGRGVSEGVAQFLAIGLVVGPLTVTTIILGELVPKIFALQNKEWVCLKLSPSMEWFSRSVWPAVWLLERSAHWVMIGLRRGRPDSDPAAPEGAMQELHGAAALARIERLIGHREQGIIVSAARLAATPLRQVMLPAEYIGMLSSNQNLAEALIDAHQDMHTRYPVTEEAGNPQRIIGYVNFKDIVAALRMDPDDPSLSNLIRRLQSFSADLSVADCLETLMRERTHIALVREPGGTIVGMITLEDIVEELVGEIHDEFDRLPTHLVPAGPGWIAGGFVPLNLLREKTGIDLKPPSEKPIYTLNDWIVERLARPPRGGDAISENGYRILVRKTRRVLVQEAYLRQLPDQTPAPPADE